MVRDTQEMPNHYQKAFKYDTHTEERRAKSCQVPYSGLSINRNSNCTCQNICRSGNQPKEILFWVRPDQRKYFAIEHYHEVNEDYSIQTLLP